MIMMHAENGIAIDVLVAQALATRRDRAEVPRHHAPVGDGRGSDAPRDHARQARGRAVVHRAHVGEAGGRDARAPHATKGGTSSARRARSTSTCRSRSTCRRPGFEGAKYVCSTPLRARAEGHQDELWRYLRTERPVRREHRPLPLLLQGAEGARRRRLLEDPERHRWRRAPHGPHLPGRRRRADLARALGRAVLHDAGAHVRPLPAQGRDRARAPTPTSSSTTRTATTTHQRRARTT